MKVFIQGKVRIKDSQGNVLVELKNSVNISVITSFLINALNNSLPSTPSGTPGIFVFTNQGYQYIGISVSTSGNEIIWTGTLKLPQTSLITSLQLWAFLQGYFAQLASVQTNTRLPAGSYTIEWVWVINDPVGLVRYLLQLGATQTFSKTSIRITAPSYVSIAQISGSTQGQVGYIQIILFGFTTSNQTISSVQLSVTVTNSSNVSTTFNLSLPPTPSPLNVQAYNASLFFVTIVVVGN